jgi:hypothetical protein
MKLITMQQFPTDRLYHTCSECEVEKDLLVELGEEPTHYGSSTALICVDCLKRSLHMILQNNPAFVGEDQALLLLLTRKFYAEQFEVRR